MKKLSYLLLVLSTTFFYGQVGINTKSPETTFEVAGKPEDLNHYDGILPPRITGDQLSKKSYSNSKKGAVVFVTSPSTNLSGQVINITETGLYYFDGDIWKAVSKPRQTIEYQITLTFDHNSEAGLKATSDWSEPFDYHGNTNAYLTASKFYSIGTKKFDGLKGTVTFRKIDGIVNVRFQIFRSYDSEPITNDAIMDIADIYSDLGYVPNQVVFLHPENSLPLIPALLENHSIQIPQASLGAISKSFYTYGEVQGYSNWTKPYLK